MKSFEEVDTIFEDMDVLNPNTQTYQPEELPEREQELNQIHSALRPATMGSTPLNIFLYGHTGQGKTAAVDLKTSQLQEFATDRDMDLTTVMVRCKGMDRSYHVMTHLYKTLREERFGPGEELPNGYQRKHLLNMILEELEAIGGTIIIVLDEIDAIGEDDYILYELSRANPEDVRLSLIGITNDHQFRDNLDADVRSSLGEDEIAFDPYQASQLRNILARRATRGLRDTRFTGGTESFESFESDVLSNDVIPLCAAIAARDTGDAREALQLLFRAARFADDEGDSIVTESHVRRAREWLEQKVIEKAIKTLPIQKQLAFMSVIWAELAGKSPASTTELYSRYQQTALEEDTDPLSNRRFRDRLNDLVDSNILNRSRGRGQGKENQYTLAVDLDTALQNIPAENEPLGDVAEQLRNR